MVTSREAPIFTSIPGMHSYPMLWLAEINKNGKRYNRMMSFLGNVRTSINF